MMDWALRPVHEKMCLYESLLNGAIYMEDLALMNNALTVKAENEFLLKEHFKKTDK